MDECCRRAALKSLIAKDVTYVASSGQLTKHSPCRGAKVVRRLQWDVQAGAGGRIVGAAEGYCVKGKIK